MKKYVLGLFILCGVIGKSQVYLDPAYNKGTYGYTTNNSFLYWIQNDGTVYLKNESGYVNKVKNIGGLDPNFGNLNIGAITSLSVADNKLLIANGTHLKRHFLEGTLDTSFGNSGMIDWSAGTLGRQYIFINSDNSFYILKNSQIEKYTGNGIFEHDFPLGVDLGVLQDIVKTKTNYFYIFYRFDYLRLIKKIDSQGNVVTSFGNNGILTLPSNMWGIVNNNDELALFGRQGNSDIIYKYTSNGVIDNNFGMNGVFQLPQFRDNLDRLGGRTFDSAGNLVVVVNHFRISTIHGMVPDGNTLVRITSSGQLDNSFNNGSASFYDEINRSAIGGIKLINDNEYLCSNWSNGLDTAHGFIKYRRTGSSLSVSEISHKADEVHFNNPFNNELKFNLKEKIKNVEIYDESGKFVLKGNTSELNTSSLIKGVYFIKITTLSNKIISRKGIKN
ncbi:MULTISPECIES: T9SS type A sorting domain-containing protein [unclassified Chryseobacterium]|uniref:T9SS type A sorting domain-containing protein n=1 Tax=unclassified Chryseobacterium TaxID=2593645 RepID=UPI000F490DF3|nr:T9SS type A sorting domain-containing protein [Chryseobacterium sp. BIGb0232]MCS4302098.1 hypothetical protein [Chryseobacterium sp. BIGb0232]ROS18044.1 putative secreted protein (Por secretion system target) [Chryseobacterium nakagawai]